jgi:uncharacterized membrane protein
MTRLPFSRLLLLMVALLFLVSLVQLGLVTVAFDKLGLSSYSAFLLLVITLAGRLINLPMFIMKADETRFRMLPPALKKALLGQRIPFTGGTLIVLNVGGGMVPLAFAIYLLLHNPLKLSQVFIATAIVAGVANIASHPLLRLGAFIPLLVAPITAALIAAHLDPGQRAAIAYISGTVGILVGADLLHLKDIRRTGVPVAAIGGAGSFDGVFLTGLLAVLLA